MSQGTNFVMLCAVTHLWAESGLSWKYFTAYVVVGFIINVYYDVKEKQRDAARNQRASAVCMQAQRSRDVSTSTEERT